MRREGMDQTEMTDKSDDERLSDPARRLSLEESKENSKLVKWLVKKAEHVLAPGGDLSLVESKEKSRLAKWLVKRAKNLDGDCLDGEAEDHAGVGSVEGMVDNEENVNNRENFDSDDDLESYYETDSEYDSDDDVDSDNNADKITDKISAIGDLEDPIASFLTDANVLNFKIDPVVQQHEAEKNQGEVDSQNKVPAESALRFYEGYNRPGHSRSFNQEEFNMQRAQENEEDQIFFEEIGRDMKDFDVVGEFQIGSQDFDLSLNMNSQDLLRYADIGNFSGVCEDDVLNKTVYDDVKDEGDDDDSPKGMDYVLALKTGIDSAQSSKILFNEIPCFTNYAGEYDFDVIPAADAKKCIYEKSLNKIYVILGTFEFKLKMNFHMIPQDEEFLLRTHINFVQPENHQKPVLRCISCQTSNEKLIDPEHMESVKYVARAAYADNQAVYYRSAETSKLYFFQPIVQPELGCDTISKGIVFTCMNSCRSGSDGSGINRREIALVFTLLNKMHQVVGRRVFTLRICTAPHRDAKLDLDPKIKTKKRRNSDEEKIQTKRPRKLASGVKLAEPMPGPSSKFLLSKQQENNVSSSQETCYSGDEEESYKNEGLLLRSLFRQSRNVLGWKRSTDPKRRQCFKNLFYCLLTAKSIIDSSPADTEAASCSGVN